MHTGEPAMHGAPAASGAPHTNGSLNDVRHTCPAGQRFTPSPQSVPASMVSTHVPSVHVPDRQTIERLTSFAPHGAPPARGRVHSAPLPPSAKGPHAVSGYAFRHKSPVSTHGAPGSVSFAQRS